MQVPQRVFLNTNFTTLTHPIQHLAFYETVNFKTINHLYNKTNWFISIARQDPVARPMPDTPMDWSAVKPVAMAPPRMAETFRMVVGAVAWPSDHPVRRTGHCAVPHELGLVISVTSPEPATSTRSIAVEPGSTCSLTTPTVDTRVLETSVYSGVVSNPSPVHATTACSIAVEPASTSSSSMPTVDTRDFMSASSGFETVQPQSNTSSVGVGKRKRHSPDDGWVQLGIIAALVEQPQMRDKWTPRSEDNFQRLIQVLIPRSLFAYRIVLDAPATMNLTALAPAPLTVPAYAPASELLSLFVVR